MTKSQVKQIENTFKNAVDLEQSCKICVTTDDGNNRSFYFKQGYIVWASSSVHRFRRLYRLLEQICPEINFQEFKLREQEISELWEYLSLKVLYKRQQISLLQARKVVQQTIIEVLFNCLVDSDRQEEIQVFLENQTNHTGAILKSPLLKQPITQLSYEKIIEPLESTVADWKAILTNCLPNHAPVAVKMEEVKESISSDVYQQLFMYINGERTFRDLAILSRQDLLKVARSLAPLIKDKTIILQQIPDRQLSNLYFTSRDPQYETTQPRKYVRELDLPLIVYVDNDADSCQQVIETLNPAGYQIIATDNAAKTLIVLLKNQPSLIIINANTTDINGYELCAQIRKMSKFKYVPIIISRQREVLDRFKAKMAGVSGFIDTPIEPEELLTLAQKYTQTFLND